MTTQIDGTTGVDNIKSGAVQTADLAPLAVTPDKTSGITVTQANQTPLPGLGAALSYTHGLGVIPVSAELELVCLTAEHGYAVGDVVTPYCAPNASTYGMLSVAKNTTTVFCRTGNSTAFLINNNTNGVQATPTAANWAWRFKLRVV